MTGILCGVDRRSVVGVHAFTPYSTVCLSKSPSRIRPVSVRIRQYQLKIFLFFFILSSNFWAFIIQNIYMINEELMRK